MQESSTSGRRSVEVKHPSEAPNDSNGADEWIYDKESGAVRHATDCDPCGEWDSHHDDDDDSQKFAHAERLDRVGLPITNDMIDTLRREVNVTLQEADILKQELGQVLLEAEQVEQDRKRMARTAKKDRERVSEGFRRDIIDLNRQLKIASEPPPSNAPSSSVPPLSRLPKRRRVENSDQPS